MNDLPLHSINFRDVSRDFTPEGQFIICKAC